MKVRTLVGTKEQVKYGGTTVNNDGLNISSYCIRTRNREFIPHFVTNLEMYYEMLNPSLFLVVLSCSTSSLHLRAFVIHSYDRHTLIRSEPW